MKAGEKATFEVTRYYSVPDPQNAAQKGVVYEQKVVDGTATNLSEAQLTLETINKKGRSFGVSVDALKQVSSIAPNGLAFEAGVRFGDILKTFNGQEVVGDALFAAMRKVPDNAPVVFEVTRICNGGFEAQI